MRRPLLPSESEDAIVAAALRLEQFVLRNREALLAVASEHDGRMAARAAAKQGYVLPQSAGGAAPVPALRPWLEARLRSVPCLQPRLVEAYGLVTRLSDAYAPTRAGQSACSLPEVVCGLPTILRKTTKYIV